MTTMIVLSVLAVVALVAGLAAYLYQIGTVLGRVADTLEAGEGLVRTINADAARIGPGVEHVNHSAGTVAAALPLLYGLAERIVAKASPTPPRAAVAVPASGRRRSRLHPAVGYTPDG